MSDYCHSTNIRKAFSCALNWYAYEYLIQN